MFTNLTEYKSTKGPKGRSLVRLTFDYFLNFNADILAIDWRVKYGRKQFFSNALRKLLPSYYKIKKWTVDLNDRYTYFKKLETITPSMIGGD